VLQRWPFYKVLVQEELKVFHVNVLTVLHPQGLRGEGVCDGGGQVSFKHSLMFVFLNVQ